MIIYYNVELGSNKEYIPTLNNFEKDARIYYHKNILKRRSMSKKHVGTTN